MRAGPTAVFVADLLPEIDTVDGGCAMVDNGSFPECNSARFQSPHSKPFRGFLELIAET